MFISPYGPGSEKSKEEMEVSGMCITSVSGVLVGMSRW